MKQDLDRLMAERNLDAVLVVGNSAGNPVMNYLTGGAHLERALVLKRRGGPLTLVHGGMERDTAAATGLRLIDRDAQYNHMRYLQEHDGNRLAAEVAYLADVIHDENLRGRLGVYGMIDAGAAMLLLNHLQDRLLATEIVGEYGETLFGLARETKDAAEIAQMAEAGRLTGVVVGETQEFVRQHAVHGDMIVKADGAPLTIGDVKSFVRTRLLYYGLSEDGDTIFAQGREAGVPHNRGSESVALRLGQTIIFDIFPRGGSGYYHDMTRTWCFGYATDAVYALYEQVKEIFDRTMAAARVGLPCRDLQQMTLDYFEAKGHPTARTHPGGHDGYVHSLGHGVGLDVHEGPSLSIAAGNYTLLAPGHVVSIEPGLYYPERGYGVRVEDTIAFQTDGSMLNLTQFPYDLVVPMG
ncbi:MAG TPA: aminopeptidase P family protein [Chloroflexi bacterium]|nr:aminopeptidase P family protein [Chloroflexota bacterium]